MGACAQIHGPKTGQSFWVDGCQYGGKRESKKKEMKRLRRKREK